MWNFRKISSLLFTWRDYETLQLFKSTFYQDSVYSVVSLSVKLVLVFLTESNTEKNQCQTSSEKLVLLSNFDKNNTSIRYTRIDIYAHVMISGRLKRH